MLKIKRFLEYKKCSCCGQEFLKYDLMKINNEDYFCIGCRDSNQYSTKNYKYKGKQTQISCSFEFETDSKIGELYELKKYGFIGCYDCSISGLEWKSPIFNNKKSFHTICNKIEKFAKYVGPHCGTHLHVSTQYKRKMDEYKKELFNPMLKVMKENPTKTKRFWGRFFGRYCQAELSNYNRYNAINTISSVETLEFRLLKFRNAKQYIRACDFCIDTTKYINNFIGREDFNSVKAKKIGEIIAKRYEEVVKYV